MHTHVGQPQHPHTYSRRKLACASVTVSRLAPAPPRVRSTHMHARTHARTPGAEYTHWHACQWLHLTHRAARTLVSQPLLPGCMPRTARAAADISFSVTVRRLTPTPVCVCVLPLAGQGHLAKLPSPNPAQLEAAG